MLNFVLQNIWLKSFICLSSSYLIGFFGIKKFIYLVNEKNILRQPIREDGPESHLKAKKNTPTMGGIFIVLATLLTTVFFLDITNHYILIASFVFIAFAGIGLTLNW